MADGGLRKPPPGLYQPKKKQRSSCCLDCCICCCCCVSVFILLPLALCGCFYAIYQPQIPVFHFKSIKLDRFNISAKQDRTAVINSLISIGVEMKNPNEKIKIYYGDTKVSLTTDDDIDLGSTSVPSFEQPVNNVTLLKLVAKVNNKVVDSKVALKLKDRMKNQQVMINAEVKTMVGVGLFNAKIGMVNVDVNCGGVTLKQLNNGNASPKCTFNVFNRTFVSS